MKLGEVAGVGIITKQNTTKDVKPGETKRQAKKLGLLHPTAAKNSDPNKLFNLGITEDADVLYHATYGAFVDSIMKNGLGGTGAQTQWEDSLPGHVYLARDPEVAESHAEANEEVPDEYIDDIVVFAIDTSKLDMDKLGDDPNVMDDNSTLAYKGVIPTSALMMAEGKRVPRKKGQKAGSKKHSDLYTDENPKGTIQGLKFATVKDAEASVRKIKSSGKKHAHKIQAAIAMEQRAKAAGKSSAAAVYRRYINAMKKKTKKMNELRIEKPDPKDTLGVKRKDMPQVKSDDYAEFIDYLQKNGAKFTKETIPARDLSAMQQEFSDAGILKQLTKNIELGPNRKAVIASSDDYIIDGHHRWLVALNTGADLNVFRVNIPAYKLYDLVNKFEKTYYKDLYDETRGSIGVPLSGGLVVKLFPHRPLRIKKSTPGKLNYNEAITQVDIDQLETFADKLFAKVGIDVEFTRHFLDRVNDARNNKPITMAELTRLFKQEFKRYGKPIAQMGPGQEAVMKDLQTDINLPFALQYDKENNELDLIAKTVMRKKDFKTPNREFPVEGWSAKYKKSINCSNPKGFSQKAHCAGKKKKSESIRESYEIEFVCVNPDFCDATEQKNQDKLFQALRAVPGIIVYKQDFDVHNSMAAIIKDEEDTDAPAKIQQLAKQHGVSIDLENDVSQDMLDDIATGRLEGLTDYYDTDINEVAPPGREKQVRKLKKKFDDPGAPYAIAWAQHNKHGKPTKEETETDKRIADLIGLGDRYKKKDPNEPSMYDKIKNKFKGYFDKDKVDEDASDKVYELLLDNIGAGPFDGGCVVVAQALQLIHGGELMALVRNDGTADHAVVQKGNTMYDFDGPGTQEEVVSRFEKNEGTRIAEVRKLRMTDLPDAPRNSKLAKQIASLMKEPVQEAQVDEGVNDPHIFKAVFLAGGPGSGKSFVAKNILGGTGLRSINSDEIYEFLMKKQDLSLDPETIFSPQGQEIRDKAKGLSRRREATYLDGRLGLIIDGTGKDVARYRGIEQKLKAIGYDTSMIYVNTSLAVAQQRNAQRERSLTPAAVEEMWNYVQQNLMQFQQMFGAGRFHIIDNSGGLEDLDRQKNFDKVYVETQRFLNTPPKHRKALAWIQKQKEQNDGQRSANTQQQNQQSDGGTTTTN